MDFRARPLLLLLQWRPLASVALREAHVPPHGLLDCPLGAGLRSCTHAPRPLLRCCPWLLARAVLSGAFAGISLSRYLTAVRPRMPLPTAKAGFMYVAILTASSVVPGLLLLQLCLLCRRRRQQSQAAPLARPNPAAAAPRTAAAQGAQPGCASAGAAAAAATLWRTAAAGNVAGGAMSVVPEATSACHNRSCSAGGSEPLPAPAAAVGGVGQLHLQLWAPGGTYPMAVTVPVASGRPPLAQLLQAWLAGLQQLPVGSGSQHRAVQVYAMGPEPLVLAVQLLCDDLNARRNAGCGSGRTKQGAGSLRPLVQFVRKSYEL